MLSIKKNVQNIGQKKQSVQLKGLKFSLSDPIERPTCLWLSIQIGCDKVGGEKPHSSVVLSFPPVWIAIKQNNEIGININALQASASQTECLTEFQTSQRHHNIKKR